MRQPELIFSMFFRESENTKRAGSPVINSLKAVIRADRAPDRILGTRDAVEETCCLWCPVPNLLGHARSTIVSSSPAHTLPLPIDYDARGDVVGRKVYRL